MNFSLTEEQKMIVETVRSFVENEIYPHEEIVERTGEVPNDIAEEIKQKTMDLGFYACNFPEEVGGAGLSHLEFALVERELGRGCMALNHFFGRPQNILMACEGDQKERYLLPAVRGERMDALAMTEPVAGSDVRGMKCSAERKGGDWIVNGNKHFISGADHADFIICFIATGEDSTPKGPKKRPKPTNVDPEWGPGAPKGPMWGPRGPQRAHMGPQGPPGGPWGPWAPLGPWALLGPLWMR